MKYEKVMSRVISVSFLKRDSVPFVHAGRTIAGSILMVFSTIFSIIPSCFSIFRFVQPDMRTIFRFLRLWLPEFPEVQMQYVHFKASVKNRTLYTAYTPWTKNFCRNDEWHLYKHWTIYYCRINFDTQPTWQTCTNLVFTIL